MAPRGRGPAAVLVIVSVAVALKLAYGPWYLNYDARYALLWAHDLWHGFSPEYTADFAPTPHPLQMAVSSLALPFGDASDEIVTWMVLGCFGGVVWLTYRLGTVLFTHWAGVVAALVVATRPAMQRDALLAYQDVPFAALIIGAVLLEARTTRRGLPVLVLLALAGLLRPEAWVLSGLYVLWLWRGGLRVGQLAVPVALAASAPVIWALSDALVTGDLLHSLHGTAALAEDNDRRRYVDQVPYWTAQYFGFTLREPLVIGIPIGLAFAWHHARRRALLPLVVAVAMTAVFAVGPVFGLPLIGRYVRTPSDLLALFYGLAVCGWLMLPAGEARRRWRIAGVVAGLLSIAFLPWHVTMLRNLENRTDVDGARYGQLRDVARDPAVRAAFAACAPLSTADHRPIPYLRYWLRGAPGSVGTVRDGASPLGRLLLVPRRNRLQRRVYGDEFPAVTPPAEYVLLYENPSWRLYAAPGCGA